MSSGLRQLMGVLSHAQELSGRVQSPHSIQPLALTTFRRTLERELVSSLTHLSPHTKVLPCNCWRKKGKLQVRKNLGPLQNRRPSAHYRGKYSLIILGSVQKLLFFLLSAFCKGSTTPFRGFFVSEGFFPARARRGCGWIRPLCLVACKDLS